MNLKEIKEIAKRNGIKTVKMKKDEIIRSIQRAEGNFDCFGTAVSGECSQVDCLWRSDCLS
ncbi:MAG: Rho termination factor N-terminal domain-containing protein [Nitrospirota bacterium]